MVFKRLVSTLIFTLATTFLCLGQQSTQATMKVQVTVVEGNSISAIQKSNIDLTKSSASTGLSELTTMTINKKSNSSVAISRPSELDLVDNEGQNLRIPIFYTDKITDKEIILKMDIKSIGENISNRGDYKGSLTTTIAYL